MEQPVLRLGLLGFSEADKQRVAEVVARPIGDGVTWQLVELEQADAWCVNGGSAQYKSGNNVEVRTMLRHMPTVVLDPQKIGRPIAFTAPVPEGISGAELVNLKDPRMISISLQRYEAWLLPLRAQFALGAELVARENELTQGVYHVLDTQGKLLAVIDLTQWRVAIMPLVRPADFVGSNWVQRPAMAADVPPGFIAINVVQLMWAYAVRTTRDMLPTRYRKQTIYMRRLPNLPRDVVRDEHLVVLRALSSAPGKYRDMLASTGLSEATLAQALAALYFAGSITTNPASAAQMERKHTPVGDQSTMSPGTSSMLPLNSLQVDSGKMPLVSREERQPPSDLDLTAPAPLFMRP